MIRTEEITIASRGSGSVTNLTERAQAFVTESTIRSGIILLFYRHTTGSVLVVESELGALVDLEEALRRIAPDDGVYYHHLRGVDQNGAAHLAGALLGVSLVLPIVDGSIPLGRYQDIVLLDMQQEAAPRSLVFQAIGDMD